MYTHKRKGDILPRALLFIWIQSNLSYDLPMQENIEIGSHKTGGRLLIQV